MKETALSHFFYYMVNHLLLSHFRYQSPILEKSLLEFMSCQTDAEPYNLSFRHIYNYTFAGKTSQALHLSKSDYFFILHVLDNHIPRLNIKSILTGICSMLPPIWSSPALSIPSFSPFHVIIYMLIFFSVSNTLQLSVLTRSLQDFASTHKSLR